MSDMTLKKVLAVFVAVATAAVSVAADFVTAARAVVKGEIRQFLFCAVHKNPKRKIGAPRLELGTFRSQSGRPTIGPCPVIENF